MRLSVLVLLLAGAAGAQAQTVEIEVNGTAASEDDYLCWAPVPARARLVVAPGAQPPSTPAQVTIFGEGVSGGGSLVFQLASSRPAAASFAPSPDIVLSLPSNGEWQTFWVAGRTPSRGSKDVRIVARIGQTPVAGSLPVMVRVRKNADALSDFEIARFMAALVRLKAAQPPDPGYDEYPRLHEAASRLGIHKSPLFLAWHRAFLLDLERRLQQIDPNVAVPYWKYDRPSQRLFTAAFMGLTEPGVDFQPGGELDRWADPVLGRLIRDPISPPRNGLVDGAVVAQFDASYLFLRSQLESRFHDRVHSHTGGWLGGPSSPADPLFFLLHANVDRTWSHWQAKHSRFDASDEFSYSAQGAYPGVGPDQNVFPQGVYARDAMWPWSISVDDHRPAVTHPMPRGSSPDQPTAVTPAGQIDYMGMLGGPDLGYCYDDIDYVGTVSRD